MDFNQEMDEWSPEKMTEARHALKVMLASPGWLIYSTIAQKQIDARRNGIILKPLATLDGALEQEFAKGECAGLMLANALVADLIEELTSTLEALPQKESDDASRTE